MVHENLNIENHSPVHKSRVNVHNTVVLSIAKRRERRLSSCNENSWQISRHGQTIVKGKKSSKEHLEIESRNIYWHKKSLF